MLTGWEGAQWGGSGEVSDSNRQLAIPVKPGAYILDAVMRNTEDYVVASKQTSGTPIAGLKSSRAEIPS